MLVAKVLWCAGAHLPAAGVVFAMHLREEQGEENKDEGHEDMGAAAEHCEM